MRLDGANAWFCSMAALRVVMRILRCLWPVIIANLLSGLVISMGSFYILARGTVVPVSSFIWGGISYYDPGYTPEAGLRGAAILLCGNMLTQFWIVKVGIRTVSRRIPCNMRILGSVWKDSFKFGLPLLFCAYLYSLLRILYPLPWSDVAIVVFPIWCAWFYLRAVLMCRQLVIRRAVRIVPLCPSCRYWIHGIMGPHCPECGASIREERAHQRSKARSVLSLFRWQGRGRQTLVLKGFLVLVTLLPFVFLLVRARCSGEFPTSLYVLTALATFGVMAAITCLLLYTIAVMRVLDNPDSRVALGIAEWARGLAIWCKLMLCAWVVVIGGCWTYAWLCPL